MEVCLEILVVINWFCWVVFGGGNKLWEDEVEVRLRWSVAGVAGFKWG